MKTIAVWGLASAIAAAVAPLGAVGDDFVTRTEHWRAVGSIQGWADANAKWDVTWSGDALDGGALLGQFARQSLAFPETDAFVAGPGAIRAVGGVASGRWHRDNTPAEIGSR